MANAAMVSVGLPVPVVGKRLEPAIQRLGWSQVRPKESVTESVLSFPMRQVPITWPAP